MKSIDPTATGEGKLAGVREGHLVSRYGVRFFAADDEKSGLLARRLEIDNLDKEIRAQRLIVEERTAAVARSESTLREAQERLLRDVPRHRDNRLVRHRRLPVRRPRCAAGAA